MRAFVRLRTADGAEWELGHGDLIGRLPTSALLLDDARVSEAHAMVSLRGGDLRLLGLRGRFSVGGPPLGEVALQVGQRIWFTSDLAVDVAHLELPDAVLALRRDGHPPIPLAGTCSILAGPPVTVVPRFEPGALARLWSLGTTWRVQTHGEPASDLEPGESFTVGGISFEVVAVPLRRAAQQATQAESAGRPPLRIVAAFDSVQLVREGHAPVVLAGLAARLISELVALGGPAPWEVVAGEIWPHDKDRYSQRRRWDVNLARLRGRLRDEGIRGDLVCAHGTGSVELLLLPGDEVEDRT